MHTAEIVSFRSTTKGIAHTREFRLGLNKSFFLCVRIYHYEFIALGDVTNKQYTSDAIYNPVRFYRLC